MQLSKYNEWFTLVANVGVLIGIIFLIVELDQNTKTSQISSYQALMERISEFNAILLVDPDVERIRSAALSNDPNMDDVDVQRYAAYYRMLQRQSELAFVQYENGIIDRIMAQRALDPLMDHLNRSNLAKGHWELAKIRWPEFGEFVEQFLEERQTTE